MKALVRRIILPWFQKHLPVLSAEERAVLEAGGLWFEREFFTGRPRWQMLFDLPKPHFTERETAFLHNEVEQLCSLVNDWEVSNQQHDLPQAAWAFIKEQGFWALTLPTAWGGHGFSPLLHSAVVTRLATRSMALAYTVMVPNSLGLSTFIQQFGTTAQKEQYLPRLASGQDISCFALTTPAAGSDATSITDTGVVCRQHFEGREVLGLCLNFEKRYITLAPVATLIGLAFRLSDPDHLLGETVDYGISVALLPAHLPGIEIGTRHRPFDLGFMNGPIRGHDVFIPLDYLIGGVECAGRGWEMMLFCLSLGRGLSMPALSSGIAQLACRVSSAYARIREQFHVPIGSFEGVQASLARTLGFSYCCEALRLLTGLAVLEGRRPGVAAAITKYHVTDMARVAVMDAMDVQAGASVQLGPKNLLANFHRAAQMNTAVEGANLLTRYLIIYGQGVVRCHPYLSALVQASRESVDQFQRLFLRQCYFSATAILRGVWQGMTRGRFIRVPAHPYAKQLKQLTRMSNVLVILTEVSLLKFSKHFKRHEALSARLGDVLSYLYLAASVLKRFEDAGRAKDEAALLEWSLSHCLHQIQEAIQTFLANFPSRFLSGLLRRVLCLRCLADTGPSDQLSQQLAARIQQDLSWRAGLTAACYKGQPSDPIAQLDRALQATLEDWPDAAHLRHAALRVDEFSAVPGEH